MNYRDISNVLGTVTSGIRLANALDLIGLERRRSTAGQILPIVGAFGAGIAVGAGIGLLFAPQPGARLRGDISKKVNQLAGDMKTAADKVEHEVETRSATARGELQYEVNGH